MSSETFVFLKKIDVPRALVDKIMAEHEGARTEKPTANVSIPTAHELVRSAEEDSYKHLNMDRIQHIIRVLKSQISNPDEDDIKYGYVEMDFHPAYLTVREQQFLRGKGYDVVVEERGFDMCGSPKSARLYVSCKLKY